jgi:predicted component of viral defense system (DUF524 family)
MPTLIKVETPEWQLEVEGKLPDLPHFIVAPTTSIQVEGAAQLSVLNPLKKGLELASPKIFIKPLFFENTQYNFYLSSTSGAVKLKLPSTATFRHRIKNITHYELNFRNNVGMSVIEVINGKDQVKIIFEVFPTKIDYRIDYVQMRDEVTAIARNLAMTVQASTFGLASPAPADLPTLIERLSLIRRYFKQLMATTNAIAQNPHSKLEKNIEAVPLDRSRRVDNRELNRVLRKRVARVGAIYPGTNIYLPERVPESVRRLTFNTPENQYMKALLLETQRNLQRVLRTQSTGDEDADLSAEEKFFKAARPEAEDMLTQLQRVLRLPFLQATTVGTLKRPSSLVFHRHPHYTALEKIARILNGGLSFGGELVEIGVKDIALLYEYWCFLRLVQLLREQLALEQQSIIQINNLKTIVVLKKGEESRISFIDTLSGQRLSLVYNRQFNRLPTIAQRPDNVIQLFSETKLYIFDAKYRLSVDSHYQKLYNGIGPTTDDINTMHRYRDAIVLPSQTDRGREFIKGVVQSAIILFPYPNEASYQNQRFYQSIDQVQIGGLPFLPVATQLAEAKIRELLQREGYFS